MANQSTTLFSSITANPLLVLPVLSDKAKGCGYNRQTNGMHTVQFTTVNGFVGVVKIQATLATTPAEEDWFDVDGMTLGDGLTPVVDQTELRNFTGNFVWVRGIITEFTAGNLNRVLYTHN